MSTLEVKTWKIERAYLSLSNITKWGQWISMQPSWISLSQRSPPCLTKMAEQTGKVSFLARLVIRKNWGVYRAQVGKIWSRAVERTCLITLKSIWSPNRRNSEASIYDWIRQNKTKKDLLQLLLTKKRKREGHKIKLPNHTSTSKATIISKWWTLE